MDPNPIKIVHFNIRSLRTGKNMLEHYLNNENVDIAMLSEHWLKPNEKINISNYKTLLNGYQI